MNILYCGDENIKEGLIISILSLLKNVDEILNIYVLTINCEIEGKSIRGLSLNDIVNIDKIVKEKNSDNFIKLIDVTKLFNVDLPIVNLNTRFTPCCMLRLYVDKLQNIPDRILYLDNDVICRKSFLNFYYQDIEKFELAGVLDYYGKWFFKNDIMKFDYINSGVLLLNMKKIKETELFEKCRNMCKMKKMFMPDQSAINKLASFKKILPRKYNEQRKLKYDTVFQHFTTSFRLFPLLHAVTIKPWQIEEFHRKLKIFEYDDILNVYQNIIKEEELEEV